MGKRDIRYNVLRAVGYYKGKPVAEDLILLNGLEQAPNFELLYQDDKKILKGEAGYNYLYRLNCGGDDYTDSFGQLWLQDNTNYSRSWAENFKDLNPYLASQRTPMIRFVALVTGRYSNISASDVISWNIVSLWQTEHIVLNCISQSLGMVRAEALLPTVKGCVYSMLP